MILLPELAELDQAASIVYSSVQASAQIEWPLLSQRCGFEVWVKHENHNPTGAFKVRGGLVYMDRLRHREPDTQTLVTATRGNHGQSIAFAAGKYQMSCVVVVPEGNNPEKNLAMRALGAELIIHGEDFDDAVEHAEFLAAERGLHKMASFNMDLVSGVASYSLELLRHQADLDRVYVPIGLGSGVCGMICARNALHHKAEIVGVVSTQADCYARSFEAGHCVSTDSANTLADGVAVRVPNPEALAIMHGNLARIVKVSDEEVLAAMRALFSDTHNVAEGAGAAALAASIKEADTNKGLKVGVILSGGNADKSLYQSILVD